MLSRVTPAIQGAVPGDLELNRWQNEKEKVDHAKMDLWLMKQSLLLIAQWTGNSAAERQMMRWSTY